MSEKKSWFGSLDLAYRYAIVFGSLLGSVLILGLIKVFFDRRRLKQHTKLAEEEGRLSKESHRELNMRDKDAGDLVGIRAIEAGYFGGVAQSANNSPVLTPRGSLGELSPTFSGPQYSRAMWSTSSSVLDLKKYGSSSAGDVYENYPSSPRQNHPTMLSSPTDSSSPHSVRKSPSPTKSPPISPAFSPITAPSMAHVRQLALRPSTAERTGRHSHRPPIEPPIDLRFEVPSAPLDHPYLMSSLQPPLGATGQISKNKFHEAEVSAPTQLVTLYDGENDTPHLLLPDFIGSSAFVVSDFDRPKSVRASVSTKRKGMGRQPWPEFIPATQVPVTPTNAAVDTSTSGSNGFRQKCTPESSPSNATYPITPPLLVESGKEYFDHSRPLTLTLTLPVRSPLRLSPASSKIDLNNKSENAVRSRENLHADADISPRTSFSFEQTLSEYRRESMIIPPSPPRKYRIGDTPMSSLSPHAMSTPLSNHFYAAPYPPAKSSRRISGLYGNYAF